MPLDSKYVITTSKLTAIGDAIRTKTGSAASMTLDEMVTAIGNISGGGGGDIEVESGSFVLTAASKTKGVECSFQPDGALLWALNSTFPTDNSWKTICGSITSWGTESWVNNRYGASNKSGDSRTATAHTYANGTLTFSWNYAMAANVTYYWIAWKFNS